MLKLTQEAPMPELRPIPTAHRDDTRFKHVEDLQEALEEYAAFHDGTIIRKYGPSTPHGSGPRTGDEMAASQERA
jgi:hypothetical protein